MSSPLYKSSRRTPGCDDLSTTCTADKAYTTHRLDAGRTFCQLAKKDDPNSNSEQTVFKIAMGITFIPTKNQ